MGEKLSQNHAVFFPRGIRALRGLMRPKTPRKDVLDGPGAKKALQPSAEKHLVQFQLKNLARGSEPVL